MVEETNSSSHCLDYKAKRYEFEEYDLMDLFDTPKKRYEGPKVHIEFLRMCKWDLSACANRICSGFHLTRQVHRCKTCRKVFDKPSTLSAHCKTHAPGTKFDNSRSKGFAVLDFAKRFSDGKMSFDPNLITQSQYEELLAKVVPTLHCTALHCTALY